VFSRQISGTDNEWKNGVQKRRYAAMILFYIFDFMVFLRVSSLAEAELFYRCAAAQCRASPLFQS